MTTYGQRIRALRTAAQVPQVLLAERIGLRKPELCEREKNVKPMSKAEYLRAAAALLEIRSERDAAFEQAWKNITGDAA